MAAFLRGRKAYYQRKRRWQRKSRKILSRRRKLYSRQRTKIRSTLRLARNRYPQRRLAVTRYFDRQMRNNGLSSLKAKSTLSTFKNKALSRKPLRVGRPMKRKTDARVRSRILQARLKKGMGKRLCGRARMSAEKRGKRKGRYSDNEIFYRLAKSSVPNSANDDRQSKKHSVRFTTPGNPKPKETEAQEDLPTENPPSQQAGPLKKRNKATPACKSY